MSNNDSLKTDDKREESASYFDKKSFIISFCNQISSPDCSLCILNTSGRASRWIDFSGLSDGIRNGFAGVCGICSMGEDVLITTQGQSPILAYVSVEEARIKKYVVLEKCKDPHSLVYSKGHVYIVSTGTNEIYRVSYENDVFGEEESFWHYPGVGQEKDEVHLNGLTLDGDNLITSCFGPRDSEGAWGTEGRVFCVNSGRSIQSGLSQPHSPMVYNDFLVFAESASGKVHIHRKSRQSPWIRDKVVALNGYTRGLVMKEQHLWVGLSANRKLSRSKGKFLYEGSGQDSEILLIDVAKGEVCSSLSVSSYGRELYDIFELKRKPDLDVESDPINDPINVRVRNMESWTDRYTADISSLAQQIYQYKRNLSALVSVIIPTYNRARFIEESIHSVLTQTYDNLEVIVVDDGSTDNTEELISAISDPRLIYIRQPNRGRSIARNHALSLAKGKYITFLDSDDLYLPNKIELQVDYLNSHPGTGMVYTSAHCISSEGEMLDHKYFATESGLIYTKIAFFTPVTITLPTVMTYREIIDFVGGFDKNMNRFEDTDIWRRISKYFRIDAISEYTCLLRTHDDNSLLNQNPEDIVSALSYYANKILQEDSEVSITTRKKGLADLYNYYANALLSVPEFSIAGKRLRRTARTYETIKDTLIRYARYSKIAYYRFMNQLYQVYSKFKRLPKKR